MDSDLASALRGVLEPELGLDIVSLGLVYEVVRDGGAVSVQLAMTAQGLGHEALLVETVRGALGVVEGVETVEVEVVWFPPWSAEMVEDSAREALAKVMPAEPTSVWRKMKGWLGGS